MQTFQKFFVTIPPLLAAIFTNAISKFIPSGRHKNLFNFGNVTNANKNSGLLLCN